MRELNWSLYLSGCPSSLDNDKREVSSGGGLWLGCRRASGATIHRKGCHGGELRLVSRQFLWCVVSSGRLVLLDLGLLPWSLLAMTFTAIGRRMDNRTERERGWRMTQRVMKAKGRARGNLGGFTPLPPLSGIEVGWHPSHRRVDQNSWSQSETCLGSRTLRS